MATHEQRRFVLQRGPDERVEPCQCGSPFGIVTFSDGAARLRCMACDAEMDATIVRFVTLDPATRRSPGHPPCPCWHRVVVPKVRDEVAEDVTRRDGAERWDLFCVQCGSKDGALPKDTLRGYRTKRRTAANQSQRPDVLARAGHRCELCFSTGVALDVGHCLSDADARALNVPESISESLWNKCALCTKCNGIDAGYGRRSMHRSVYVTLAHTRDQNRKMLDVGPEAADRTFMEIFKLLKLARQLPGAEAA